MSVKPAVNARNPHEYQPKIKKKTKKKTFYEMIEPWLFMLPEIISTPANRTMINRMAANP